jgi:hypothetical protein
MGQRLPDLLGDPAAALRLQSEIAGAWVRLCASWWEGVLGGGAGGGRR